MQNVINDVKNTPRTIPLIPKNVDTTQVELQRQIDKLNDKIGKGKDHDKIIARINTINEDIALVRAENDKERESMKTWGMAPKTWKYVGGFATAFALLADIAAISSNIPLTALVDNTTLTIIVTTSVTSGVGMLAVGIFGAFTYGQIKVDKRLEVFDQKVRQNELLSIFLNSYQEFMSNNPDSDGTKESNLEIQVAELKKCVEQLKNISSSTVPQEAKDHWLSTMIEKLPDEADSKKNLLEMKVLAEKIEKKKTSPQEPIIQDASSEQPEFLKTTRADQAADLSFNMIGIDPLREKYNANMQALREEFGMDIQQPIVKGYKLNANAKMKKIKKNEGSVVIDIEI